MGHLKFKPIKKLWTMEEAIPIGEKLEGFKNMEALPLRIVDKSYVVMKDSDEDIDDGLHRTYRAPNKFGDMIYGWLVVVTLHAKDSVWGKMWVQNEYYILSKQERIKDACEMLIEGKLHNDVFEVNIEQVEYVLQ